MRFLFTESFGISEWNGEQARITKGISGSHTAAMYLAEALVLQNQEVDFVSLRNQMIPTKYKGVQYMNIQDFSPMEKEYDFLITTHNLNDLQILSKIHIRQKIILIMHNELYNDDGTHSMELFYRLDASKVALGFISETSKRLILGVQPFLVSYSHQIIHNSLDLDDLYDLLPMEEKKPQFVFFANPDRGFELARRVLMEGFPDFQMVTSCYGEGGIRENTEQKPQKTGQIIYSPSSSKETVYAALKTAKYFVYPLVCLSDNPYTNHYIHYDTFGYVILEALCHGVIVIAPRMAVYEELFGDAVCYVDSGNLIEPYYFQEWRKHNRNFGEPLLSNYISKIRELESNSTLRNSYFQKGRQLRSKFAHQNIANRWLRILDERKQNDLRYHLRVLSYQSQIPYEHIQYLRRLKQQGFEPKVIYDIGACVGAWTKVALDIWPEARVILFEANGEMEFLYGEMGKEYSMGLLGKEDGGLVKYYQNDFQPTGNSYYREIGCEHGDYHPENQYLWKPVSTLDTIRKQRGFPLPDFVKMDVQGAEWDIFLGARETFREVGHLVMELQHKEYNQGALKNTEMLPKMLEHGWQCITPLFCNNGPDGDYDFIPVAYPETP
jgi:FkbM family methyltransferase